MEIALLTVGDELLAGDTENTNATWLARQLTARGATVTRILVVPDDAALIERTVRDWRASFDAVIATGGLGGTHDDVTMAAVAAAFDRPLVVEDATREDVAATARAFREANPDLAERHPDFSLDVDAWAATPEGAEPLLNAEGLSPGCVLENVYVFPGVPEEMKAMFESVADRFAGDVVSETLYTAAPEGAVTAVLDDARERFDVVVGSYPVRGDEPNRIRVSGSDADAVADAAAWLRERVEPAEGTADGA